MDLDPANQQYVNDLGWSLLEAANLIEAKCTLERAVAMNPSDELARENLQYCSSRMKDDGKLPDIA